MFPNESAPNLLQGLNPEQLSAVTWPPQSALVLAGAGSGKTRVLTTRIAWLLQSGQASVHSIMAVTFTNKAAKEMQTRLGAMIPSTSAPCGSARSTASATASTPAPPRRRPALFLPNPRQRRPAFPDQTSAQKPQHRRRNHRAAFAARLYQRTKRIRLARFRLERARSAHTPHD